MYDPEEHDFSNFNAVHSQVTFVSASGVMAVPMGKGEPPVVCRRQFPGAFIHLDAADGIRAEMASKRQPVPWYSRAERNEALALVRGDQWLKESDRQEIIQHISDTAHYAWD